MHQAISVYGRIQMFEQMINSRRAAPVFPVDYKQKTKASIAERVLENTKTIKPFT